MEREHSTAAAAPPETKERGRCGFIVPLAQAGMAVFVALMLFALGCAVDGYLLSPKDKARVERQDTRTETEVPMPQRADSGASGTWVSYFYRNARVAARGFAYGAVSLGALSLVEAYRNGAQAGDAADSLGWLAAEASGAPPAQVTAGLFLPHAIPELLALAMAWGLGLRLGLVWLWPLPGARRLESARRLALWSFRAVLVVVPLLLLAAVSEAYVSPRMADRYILRLGEGNAGLRESRIGTPFRFASSAWRPDRETMALLDGRRGALWLSSPRSSVPRGPIVTAPDGFVLSAPSWSPRGDRIVVARRPRQAGSARKSALVLVDPVSGRFTTIDDGPIGVYLGAAWSPRGDLIAALVGDPISRKIDIWVHHLPTGDWGWVTNLPRGENVGVTGLAWDPRGEEIAFVRLVTPRGPTAQRAGPLEPARPRAWTISVVTSDGSRMREVLQVPGHTPLSWSPDGSWIAFVEADSKGSGFFGNLAAVSPDGKRKLSGLARADVLSSLSWSHDGQRIAYHRLDSCVVGQFHL